MNKRKTNHDPDQGREASTIILYKSNDANGGKSEEKPLSDKEISRIESLHRSIDDYYEKIPLKLGNLPDAQKKCLELLSKAEQALTPPNTRKNIIDAKLALVRMEIELQKSQNARISYGVVASIAYITVILIGAAFATDWINQGNDVADPIFIGVPVKIWFWAFIGSLTSMLIRAGHYPFTNKSEAIRWLVTRPLVGVIMGVMTYLMVLAGLIVFSPASTQSATTVQTVQLLWIIAFLGGFSDTLSVNLLQRILGKFQTTELAVKESDNSKEKPAAESVAKE